MLKEMKDGNGPIWMDTVTALGNLRETLSPREVKHLEAEAWEYFLLMSIPSRKPTPLAMAAVVSRSQQKTTTDSPCSPPAQSRTSAGHCRTKPS